MNRRIAALGFGLAGLVGAIPASTHATDQQINLNAVATRFCSFDADGGFFGLDNIGVDSTSRPVSMVHLVAPTNGGGMMQDASFTFLIHTTCNAPSEYRLTTLNGGMKNFGPTPISGSWLNRIDYSAHVTLPALAGSTSSLNTNGAAGAQSTLKTYGVPYSGQLQVTFSIINNSSAPLMGGNYTDTLTITVDPQM